MQLVYRGQTYTTTAPSIETTSTEIIGKYRGHTLTLPSTVGMGPAREVQLSYRGIRYTHNR